MAPGWLIAVAGLQEAAILVEDFFAGVTGQALECRVDVNQDVVLLAFLFGNHDAVVGGVDHHLQQLALIILNPFGVWLAFWKFRCLNGTA
jgi:hypothetical protein